MRVVIIEDEVLSARRLSKLVTEVLPEAEVVVMLESVHESLAWFDTHDKPDLIFLDIQLNDGTGFDIVRELKDHPHIIFTTAYEQYALDAFKFNSIDYLLKPIDKEELHAAVRKLQEIHEIEEASYREKLENARQHFLPEFRERFLVKIGLQYKSISAKSIAYFSYREGISYLHTAEHSLPIDHTLDHLMEQLDPKHFFRVNRQFIVNINHISEIHSYLNSRLLLTLNPSTDQDVIVSRERVMNFKLWAGM